MTRIGITTLILLFCFKGIAQSDIAFSFYNAKGRTSSKDTATLYSARYRNSDGTYSFKEYRIKGNELYLEGSYMDTSSGIRLGTFKWYNESGSLNHTIEYVNGKIKTKEFFYENGKKKAMITYLGSNKEQRGWDENGNEIPNYIVEKEAQFPQGKEGWRKYLERNLDASVAERSGLPPGVYPVKIQFIVDKEGNITDVKAASYPLNCPLCAKEAERVIGKGPKWEPAIENNSPAIYQAFQFVSFQVSR